MPHMTNKYVFDYHIRENDCLVGYMAKNGERVNYGRQYYWLYFTGRIK